MAGAQAETKPFQLKEQFYIAARLHLLEQAERGSGKLSFWIVEAAAPLQNSGADGSVRHTFHLYPRVVITLAFRRH